MRLLPLLLTGCTASSVLVEGPAVWPFLLSTDVGVGPFGSLRRGLAAVVVLDVDAGLGVLQSAVDDAEVVVQVQDGPEVRVPHEGTGLYLSEPLPELFLPADHQALVTATFGGETRAVIGPGVEPVPVQVPLAAHPSGEALEVPLPRGYAEDYDQVLSVVFDEDGEEVWSDVPQGWQDWLAFAADEHTPPSVTLPGRAFPEPGRTYLVAVFVVRRARSEARFFGLASQLSGFTTGSALLVPVVTR